MSVQDLIKESGSNALLTRAVDMDEQGKHTEAFLAYQAGIEQLMTVYRGIKSEEIKCKLKVRISKYIERAEELRKIADNITEEGQYHKVIQIENDSCGNDYPVIFTQFIDSSLTEVIVEDPYVRSTHQVYNFLRFCEMLVTSTAKVRTIRLVTGPDDKSGQGGVESQTQRLRQLGDSLRQHSVELTFEFSTTLHDREIRFNNGWIIKIGRGLDYFKATEHKFSLGFCDMSLRRCYQTTINVFHKKHTKSADSS